MASGLQKIALIFVSIIFILSVTFLGRILFKTHKEYVSFKNKENRLDKELKLTEQQLCLKQKFLKKLKTEPDFFDWVVRQQLGYAKPTEIIYRFEDNETNLEN